MTDWIEREIQQQTEAKQEDRWETDLIRFKRTETLRLAPNAYEGLKQAILKDIGVYNRHFPDVTKRLNYEDVGDSSFTVRRPHGSFYMLTVRFVPDDPRIEYKIEVPSNKPGEAAYQQSSFGITTSGEDVTLLHRSDGVVTASEASERLLKPALKGRDGFE